VLFVDNRDSFVHNLGDYVRQTGAEVATVRAGFPERLLEEIAPDLVFISPGPGIPRDFGVPELVQRCVELGLPVFGVCLGLQGIVEAFGGELGVLDSPVHVLATTEEGVVRAVEHRHLPVAAVQFHPESILTLKDDLGLRLITQAVGRLVGRAAGSSAPTESAGAFAKEIAR
jgi:anthranilate synthase